MAYEYKRVDVSHLNGLKQAERLQANGWKVISGSLFIGQSLLMEKKVQA